MSTPNLPSLADFLAAEDKSPFCGAVYKYTLWTMQMSIPCHSIHCLWAFEASVWEAYKQYLQTPALVATNTPSLYGITVWTFTNEHRPIVQLLVPVERKND